MSLYLDVVTCPNGHKRAVHRQSRSIGKVVSTYCTTCRRLFKTTAGQPKSRLSAAVGGITKEKP